LCGFRWSKCETNMRYSSNKCCIWYWHWMFNLSSCEIWSTKQTISLTCLMSQSCPSHLGTVFSNWNWLTCFWFSNAKWYWRNLEAFCYACIFFTCRFFSYACRSIVIDWTRWIKLLTKKKNLKIQTIFNLSHALVEKKALPIKTQTSAAVPLAVINRCRKSSYTVCLWCIIWTIM
jgi:hypothetical protein